MSNETILLNLSSSQATLKNGTFKSNVTFPLNGLLVEDHTITRVEVSLTSFQIPFIFYSVNYTNNQLNYTISALNYSVTMTTGFYTANSLITELKTQFATNNHSFTITINGNNGRLTFASSIDFTFLSTSTCLVILGFTDTMTSTASSLTLPYPANLLGITKLRISSTELTTDNRGGNLLMTVPVNVPYYGVIQWENNLNLKSNLKNRSLNNIDILITDQYGNPINTNNQDWDMMIALTIFRDWNLRSNLAKILDSHNTRANEAEAKQEEIKDNDDPQP